MDPGPSESSPLWKKLDAYHAALAELTVESVLAEEDLLSFVQHKHQPLIQFLTEKRHLSAILKYVTTSPEDNTEYSQKSCKILCHNFSDVRDEVFTNATENLDILFGFEGDSMESDALKNLDGFHASLLNQVVLKFLNTHNGVMVEYLSTKPALQEKPIQLLNSPGLLVTLLGSNFAYSDITKWLDRINLLGILVEGFSGNHGDKILLGASEVLGTLVLNQTPLMHQFESNLQHVAQLVNNVFSENNPHKDLAVSESLTIFNSLAGRYHSNSADMRLSEIPGVLRPILDNISKFKELLDHQSAQELVNTSGTLVPFGMTRMRVVELFRSLIQIPCELIIESMANSDLFPSLLNAFFRHKWNNILQTAVMSMFNILFAHPVTSSFLQRTDMVTRISELLLEDCQRQQQGEPISAVYGFLVQFRSKFIELQKQPEIKAAVFDKNEAWNRYIQTDPAVRDELSLRAPGIFDGYTFVVDVPDQELSKELTSSILHNGGRVAAAVECGTSYVVCTDENLRQSDAANKARSFGNVPLVTPEFVRQSVTHAQLQPCVSYEPQSSNVDDPIEVEPEQSTDENKQVDAEMADAEPVLDV